MEENKDTQAKDTQTNANNEGKAEVKTFTQDELNEILSKRLSEDRKKAEREFSERLSKEKAEAERLAKLSEEEKSRELVNRKESELAEKERQLNLSFNKLSAIEDLSKEGIPMKFVDFVLDSDIEKQKERIKVFVEDYKKSIQDGVSKQLEGKIPPKDMSANSNKGIKKPISLI